MSVQATQAPIERRRCVCCGRPATMVGEVKEFTAFEIPCRIIDSPDGRGGSAEDPGGTPHSETFKPRLCESCEIKVTKYLEDRESGNVNFPGLVFLVKRVALPGARPKITFNRLIALSYGRIISNNLLVDVWKEWGGNWARRWKYISVTSDSREACSTQMFE